MDTKYNVKDCWPFFHKWTLWTKWKRDEYLNACRERRERVCLNCGKSQTVSRDFTSVQLT